MKRLGTLTALLLCGLMAVPGAAANLDELARDFAAPPAAARPWVYWFIMDGNVSREGITADLEAMARVGVGGAILMEVNLGIPRGPVNFMSDQWKSLIKHAVEEAERLGLQLTLNAGPGWTGSGGPWVKPEQSMQHLVASETAVTGPAHFDALLPRPAARKPYFGTGGLTPEMIAAQEAFYADVAVLAVPKTAARIADVDEKALYLRHPYSSRPGTVPYLPSPAAAAATGEGAIPLNRVIDLSAQLQPDGRLAWDAPPGDWTILRLGRTSTGANTRPAPLPGLGLESDKFDPAALDAHYDAFVGALLRTIGPRLADRTTGWTNLHIDSWEMGSQNWSGRFAEEFQSRRGYDPRPYLPAYTGRVVGSPELTERFLWDVRKTAQELVIEKHAERLKELGRRDGFHLSIEPYDMNPAGDLALGAVADVPMCEFWAAGDGFQTSYCCVEAVSVAHTCGRPIVAAESFTAERARPWMRSPREMKNQADWAFATGINRLVFHRYALQPWLDRVPGMTMAHYGTQYERTQTWWELSGAWHAYLARCQHLLRQGLPVADILYLAPEGAPHVFLPPPSALTDDDFMPDRKGYNFDGCDPATLIARASVRDGAIVFPDGMSYRLLVLPNSPTMTPELAGKLKALIEAGATVLGARPAKSPSLVGYPQCDEEIARLAAGLWDDKDTPGVRTIGKGRLIVPGPDEPSEKDSLYVEYPATARLLESLGVAPDFESDQPLRYTHRRVGAADVYFVSNTSGKPVSARCSFRAHQAAVELWDPLTGQRGSPQRVERAERHARLTLPLEAHGSVFVVFRDGAAANELRSAQPGSPPLEPAAEITGPWEVAFQPGRGAPERITLERLISWTEHPEPGIKHFSGEATYRTEFDWQPLVGPVKRVFLDLGRVEVMAQIKVNDKPMGTLWCAPYRLEITSALRPGENRLEVRLANLWPNRMIGDAALAPTERITSSTFQPFKPDSPLLPSGLLGPVRLLEAAE